METINKSVDMSHAHKINRKRLLKSNKDCVARIVGSLPLAKNAKHSASICTCTYIYVLAMYYYSI